MSSSAEARGVGGPTASLPRFILRFTFRLLGLAFVDAVALWLLLLLVNDGNWPLVVVFGIVTLGLNVIFLREELYPLRWIAPGGALMVVMVIYPLLFTVYIAFTNYSDGHLLNKQQAIRLLSQQRFLPEEAETFQWTAFRSPEGEIALWLTTEGGVSYFARPGAPVEPAVPGEGEVGTAGEEGIPNTVGEYARLSKADTVRQLSTLDDLEFGEPPNTVKIASLARAARYESRYLYQPEQDAILDQQTGRLYRANPNQGAFISEEGELLRPGYQVTTGTRNFERIFNSPALRGPFIRVFVWTFAFAILSVLTTFALGLFLAIVFNDAGLPGRKLIRSLLIIPYAIPGPISVLIWRGLLNPRFGPINDFLQGTLGWNPSWFSDPMLAKAGILLINLWLGYPYMMLISSGALQSIPQDIYEAAAVDGANVLQKFWNITLPLLLVSLGPLLIASFAFNFNNFNLIYLFNEGGPPIAGSPTPAGHTDILISYTYRLAFAGGRGSDYGYAAAITIIIFLLVASLTLVQFRSTKRLEEVSENV